MKEETTSLLVVLLTYAVAFISAFLTGIYIQFLHPLIIVLICDVVATLVVYMFSSIYTNASLYDPYWSVAPIFIALYFFIINPFSGNLIRKIGVLSLTFVWGMRLTWNWAQNWQGLKDEDWRYRMYRNNNPKLFWLINLFGIQFMPTILVYLGCLSLFPSLVESRAYFTYVDIFAISITFLAIVIESVADKQLKKFIEKRESHKKIMKEGLWKYSRHPNYFGEILFWWGLYCFALASNLDFWWTIIGPIGITVLFIFVSIPLMDERNLKRRPQYKEYMKKTSKLIPWKKN
ncbi:MAG: DUF1295 domain-containing protein [Candidatus Lokiarchaeota archaeon]|nr:DUF1295 domain-containing protein [Candidatus Lokiarchaeota archaeon]